MAQGRALDIEEGLGRALAAHKAATACGISSGKLADHAMILWITCASTGRRGAGTDDRRPAITPAAPLAAVPLVVYGTEK